jgi:prophage regulatory protein
MSAQIKKALTLLRRKQVESRTGLPCSSIYAKMTPNPKRPGDYDPTFPKPISLVKASNGRNSSVRWVEAEIDAWLTAQVEKSRKA